MKILGKVHCFFEQSGTFKNEFIKLGIPAEDYDIQNNFNETDHIIDLFGQIEAAYEGGASVFDTITKDDLIMAFFPCIYFCAVSQMNIYWNSVNYRKLDYKQRSDEILKRSHNREMFFALAVKMLTVAKVRGLRLIMENPWSEQTFLKSNFIIPPTLVDMNRQLRGDAYRKPTAFWFINCDRTYGTSYTKPKKVKTFMTSKGSPQAGICSEERSMITPDYARNFICDFILGFRQTVVPQQVDMFDELERQTNGCNNQ